MDAGSDGKLCLRQAGLRPRFGKGLPHLVHELAVWTASSRHGGHRPRRNGVPSIALGAQAKLLPATSPPRTLFPCHSTSRRLFDADRNNTWAPTHA